MTLKEKKFWSSKLFLFVLVLKIAASFFFGSSYLRYLFVPFLNWFVNNGFQNPWDFFYSQKLLQMFPYPSVMLWIMSLPRVIFTPFLGADWHAVTALHLFAARIPLLFFDILLFSYLLKFFPRQQGKLIWIYWCSPIIFFINYVYGQLDIIPTALFFISVYFLIQEKYLLFTLILALSAASKTHVFIAIPFVWVYLYKKRIGFPRLAGFTVLFAALFLVLISPYAGSPAFWQMVFNSPEQKRLFDFTILISPELRIVVCPTILALLFIKFVSYPKLNREILLMFLGVVFTALVIFVPPMPGWFMWSLPFLIYFYMHNKNFSSAPFVIYNIVYFIYFVSFFESHGNWIERLQAGFPIRDIAFSVVTASVGFIIFLMFKLGIHKNEELKLADTPLLIGIGGDSGAGKHTLLRVLRSLVGKSRSIAIQGDDFHNWERGDQSWNVYTHLNPSANRLHESAQLAVALKDGREIEMVHYDHKTGKFTDSQRVQPNKFIFFVGLHPFFLKKMRGTLPIKIYLDTDETLRREWKTRRDVGRRGYQPDKVAAQIASRQEDRRKFIEPQKEFADLIISYHSEKQNEGRFVFKTVFILDNSVDLKNLVSLLGDISSLSVSHTSTIYKQHLEVSGDIQARQILGIARQLDVNFDELLINPKGWVKGHKGVAQLVFLMLYNHTMKA